MHGRTLNLIGAIAFGQADMMEIFRENGGVVDIAYSVEMNDFRGKIIGAAEYQGYKGVIRQ
ncbi:MAG: hypothetical protein MZV63_51960 [Marinilabiliales bacterium]|nr:hypothetical protein [Marinilabiliales bacterium]